MSFGETESSMSLPSRVSPWTRFGDSRCGRRNSATAGRRTSSAPVWIRWRGFLIGIRCGLGGCNPKSPFRLARRPSATLIFVSLIPQYGNPDLGSSERLPSENHPGIMHGGSHALSSAPGCDEPTSRCQTTPSIWTLGRHQPVIPGVPFIR